MPIDDRRALRHLLDTRTFGSLPAQSDHVYQRVPTYNPLADGFTGLAYHVHYPGEHLRHPHPQPRSTEIFRGLGLQPAAKGINSLNDSVPSDSGEELWQVSRDDEDDGGEGKGDTALSEMAVGARSLALIFDDPRALEAALDGLTVEFDWSELERVFEPGEMERLSGRLETSRDLRAFVIIEPFSGSAFDNRLEDLGSEGRPEGLQFPAAWSLPLSDLPTERMRFVMRISVDQMRRSFKKDCDYSDDWEKRRQTNCLMVEFTVSSFKTPNQSLGRISP
ncbi:hypothetical protein PPACK8108_LOCUS8403, partial [Phakopsora pachyrhizi]